MPRGKKSVKINEPVVNEAEVTEAEEVKTTVEVTANPETTEPENVTITRDENGEVISVQPTQELIDQQNAEAEKEEEEKAEAEAPELPKNDETPFEDTSEEKDALEKCDESDEKDTEKCDDECQEYKAESTVEPLTPTAANRGIANQIITNPYGRRSVGYQPNPSRAVFTKADSQGNASVTVFGRRGEERIKRDWTSL